MCIVLCVFHELYQMPKKENPKHNYQVKIYVLYKLYYLISKYWYFEEKNKVKACWKFIYVQKVGKLCFPYRVSIWCWEWNWPIRWFISRSCDLSRRNFASFRFPTLFTWRWKHEFAAFDIIFYFLNLESCKLDLQFW